MKKRIIFPFCTVGVIINKTEMSTSLNVGDAIIAFPLRSIVDIFLYKNRLGTLAEVQDVSIDDDSVKIQLKGLMRTRIKKINRLRYARHEKIDEDLPASDSPVLDTLRKKSQELIFLINVDESDKLIRLLNYIIHINQITDFVSNYFILNNKKRRKLYYELDIIKRSNMLQDMLDDLIEEINRRQKNKQ